MLQNKRNINFLIRSGYLKNCLKGNIFFFNVFKKIDFIFLEQCHFSVIKKNKKFPLSFLLTSLKNFFLYLYLFLFIFFFIFLFIEKFFFNNNFLFKKMSNYFEIIILLFVVITSI